MRSVTKLDPMLLSVRAVFYDTKRVKPGEALDLTHWLIHISLLASESVMFPLEDWRKAHTLQAKLATLQKLGTSQNSNQTHPMLTKCHYLQKLLPTRKHV